MKQPVRELTPHPTNIQIYGEPDDGLKRNLKENGQQYPIEVDPDGRILSGARRWKAAMALGWDEVEVVVVRVEDDAKPKTKKPTEKARKEAVEKWSNTPAENPRYRGATPSDVGRALLAKPIRHYHRKGARRWTRRQDRRIIPAEAEAEPNELSFPARVANIHYHASSKSSRPGEAGHAVWPRGKKPSAGGNVMRRTLAVLATIIVTGCMDGPQPLEPVPEDVTVRTYTGADATARALEIVRGGLADPVLLKLNAELNGRTVEQHRAEALKTVATLEKLLVEHEAKAMSGRCADNPDFDYAALWTEVSLVPPIFPGWPLGEEYRVTGYTAVTGKAMLETTVSAYHGRLHEWDGPPAHGAEFEYHKSDSTLSCALSQVVDVQFAPRYRPGYAWGLTSHRYQDANGRWHTENTDVVGFNGPGGPPVDDPVIK